MRNADLRFKEGIGSRVFTGVHSRMAPVQSIRERYIFMLGLMREKQLIFMRFIARYLCPKMIFIKLLIKSQMRRKILECPVRLKEIR